MENRPKGGNEQGQEPIRETEVIPASTGGDLGQTGGGEGSKKWLNIFQLFCVCQSDVDITSYEQVIR